MTTNNNPQQHAATYTIERPRLPVTIYLLAIVIFLALCALGIAAFTAFSKVAGFWQALFSALVIEIAGIVEAIALIRSRNWIGLGGMVVTLAVSGTYNYIQAEQAGKLHDITNWWQLATLALGPLAALTVLSLTEGQELRNHEARVSKWQKDRQAWLDQRTAEATEAAERANEERKAAEERAAKERKEAEERAAQERYYREKLALEAEIKKEQIRAEEERKVQVAKARIEARERSRQESGDDRKLSGNFPGSDWRKLPAEDKAIIRTLDPGEIARRYGVSDRTARNWASYARSNGVEHAE